MSTLRATGSSAGSERKVCSLASTAYFGSIKEIEIPDITSYNKLPEEVDPIRMTGLLLNVCAAVRQIEPDRFLKEFAKLLVDNTQGNSNQLQNVKEAIPGIIGMYIEPRQPDVPEYYHTVTACRRPGRQAAKRENRTCGCGMTRMMVFFKSEDSEGAAGLVISYVLKKPNIKFLMKDITAEWRDPSEVLSDAVTIFKQLEEDIDEYNMIGTNRDQVEQDSIPEADEDEIIPVTINTTSGFSTTGGEYPEQGDEDTGNEAADRGRQEGDETDDGTQADTEQNMVAEHHKMGSQETATTGSPPVPQIFVTLPTITETSTPTFTYSQVADPSFTFQQLTPVVRERGGGNEAGLQEDADGHKGEKEKPRRSGDQPTPEEEAQQHVTTDGNDEKNTPGLEEDADGHKGEKEKPRRSGDQPTPDDEVQHRRTAKPKRRSAHLPAATYHRRGSGGAVSLDGANWLPLDQQTASRYGSLADNSKDVTQGVQEMTAALSKCQKEKDHLQDTCHQQTKQIEESNRQREEAHNKYLQLLQQNKDQEARHKAERDQFRSRIETQGRSIGNLKQELQRQKEEAQQMMMAINQARQREEEMQQKLEDITSRYEKSQAKLNKKSNELANLQTQLKASLEKQKMLENINKRSSEDKQALQDKIASLEAQLQLEELKFLDMQQELKDKIHQECSQQAEHEVRQRLAELKQGIAQKIEQLKQEKQKLQDIIQNQEGQIRDLEQQKEQQPKIQHELQEVKEKMVTWQEQVISQIQTKFEEAIQRQQGQRAKEPERTPQLDGNDDMSNIQSNDSSDIDEDNEVRDKVEQLQRSKKTQKRLPAVPMPTGQPAQTQKSDKQMEDLLRKLEESERRNRELSEREQQTKREKEQEKQRRLQAEKTVKEAELRRKAMSKPREDPQRSSVGGPQTHGRSQSPPREEGDQLPDRSTVSQIKGLSVASRVAYTEVQSALEEVDQIQEECISLKCKIDSELEAPTAPQVEQLNNSVIHSLRDFMSKCEDTKKCIKGHMTNEYIFKISQELTAEKVLTALNVLKTVTETTRTLINNIRDKFNELELGVKQDTGSLLPVDIKSFCGFNGDTTVFEFLKQYDRRMEAARARPPERLTYLWEHLDLSVQLDCVGQQEDLEALRNKLIELYGNVQKVIDQKITGLAKLQVDAGILGQKHLDQVKKYRAAILKINEITTTRPELRTKLSGVQNKRAITAPWSGHPRMWDKWQTYRQNARDATTADDFDWFLTLVAFLSYYVDIVAEDVESYAPTRKPKGDFDKDQGGKKNPSKDFENKKPDQKQDQKNYDKNKKSDNPPRQSRIKANGTQHSISARAMRSLSPNSRNRCEDYSRLHAGGINPKAPAWVAKANLMKEEKVPCFVCPDGDNHLFFECDTALALTCQQRLDKAKQKKCCYECLLPQCLEQSKKKCIYWIGAIPCDECWFKAIEMERYDEPRLYSAFLCTRHKLKGDDLKLFLTILREHFPNINLDVINMNMMSRFSRVAKEDARTVEMREFVRNEYDMKDQDEPCFPEEKYGPCVNLETGAVLKRVDADQKADSGRLAIMARPPERSTVGQCFIQTARIGNTCTTVFYDTGAQSGAITPEVVKAAGATKIEGKNRLVVLANNERYYTNMGTYVLSLGPYKGFDTGEPEKNVRSYCTVRAMGFEQISEKVPYTVWDPATTQIRKYGNFWQAIEGDKKPEVTLDLPIGLLIGMTTPELMPRVIFTTPCGIMVAKTAIPDHDGSYLIYGGCPEIYWDLGLSFQNRGTKPVASNAIMLAMQARAAIYRDSVQGNSGHRLFTIPEEEQTGAEELNDEGRTDRAACQLSKGTRPAAEVTTDMLTNLINKALLENGLVKEVMTEGTNQNNVGNVIDVTMTGQSNCRTNTEQTAQNFYTGSGIQYDGISLKDPSGDGEASGKYTYPTLSQTSSIQQLEEQTSSTSSPTSTAGAKIQQDRSTQPSPPREAQLQSTHNTMSSDGVVAEQKPKGKSAGEPGKGAKTQKRQGAKPNPSQEAQLHSTHNTNSSDGVVAAAQKPKGKSAGKSGKNAKTQQCQSTKRGPVQEAQLHSTHSTMSSDGVVIAAQKPNGGSAGESGKGAKTRQSQGIEPDLPMEAQLHSTHSIASSGRDVAAAQKLKGSSAGESGKKDTTQPGQSVEPSPPREEQLHSRSNTMSSEGPETAEAPKGKLAGEPSTGVRSTESDDTNPRPDQSKLQSDQDSSVQCYTATDVAGHPGRDPVQDTGRQAGKETCPGQLDNPSNSTTVTDTGQERQEVTTADTAGVKLHCFHCAMFSPEEQCNCADDAMPGEMVVCHCEEKLDEQARIRMLTWSEELPIVDDQPVGFRKKLKQELRQYEDWETTGLGVEYRCPRCQQCADCKAGGHRNKTILEEKEQAIIEDSITLDYENKRTYVRFPFISDPATLKEKWEKDSNRDQAMAVLKTQLNKSQQEKEQMHDFWKDFQERGYVVEYDKLSPNVKKKIKQAPINHYYVWRAVWKEASASTPCRMVVDPRLSGLNSKLARGRNNLNDLYSLLIDFRMHEFAAALDVKKMYNSMHVVEDDYCYSLILFPDNMSPDGQIRTYVLTRAMYGVISSGNQAETAIRRAAREHRLQFPLGAQLIQYKMYVDDAADARDTVEERDGAIEEATEVLAKIGFDIKCVTKSGEEPHEKATTNGRTAGLVGLEWDSKNDKLALAWREANFNKKKRGKKQPNKHPVVKGDDIDEDILPKTWTKRICISKALETYDPLGIFEPIKAKLKMDMSNLNKFEWDEPIPESYVEVWILNIRLIQDLRHIEVPRCMVPLLATDNKVRILIISDASQTMASCAAYAGYHLLDGNFSCSLITAKSKTVKETVPRNELQGCLMGSELCYTIKRAYKGYTTEIIHATDSSVSMSWLHEERKVLKQWAYNRVAQVHRLCWDTCEYRHVPGTKNTADLATKGEAVTTDMVGPDSVWTNGYEWMSVPTERFPEYNVVTYDNFQMSKEDKRLAREEEYDRLVEFRYGIDDCEDSGSESEPEADTEPEDEPEPGIPNQCLEIFKNDYEVLTAVQEPIGSEVTQLAGLGMAKAPKLKLPDLLVDPSKFGWEKAVRITSLVITYVVKFRRKFLEKKNLDKTKEDWLTRLDQEHLLRLQSNRAMTGMKVPSKATAELTERDTRLILGWTFAYYLRAASKGLIKELKNKDEYVEISGIVYYGGRMATPIVIQDQDLDCESLYDAHEINKLAPVIVSESPVAYAITMFFHWFLHQHRGARSSSALLDNDVLIINGAALMKSIKCKCTVCIKQVHRTMKKKMAELSIHQFMPAPPFYSCQMDIAYGFKVQGVNKRTTAKWYALVMVCTTTSAVRIWSLEDITVGSVLLALERHAAVHGYPKNLLIDSGTQLMKLREVEIQFQDLAMKLKEGKYNVTVSAVQDHEARGKVERYIREIRRVLQTSFENVEKQSAIQWETTFAQISNFLNNMPLYARGNPDLPSLVTPNRLLMGRNNYRVPVGDMVELPPPYMLNRHNKITRMILDTIIENQTALMRRSKWTKDDEEPEIGDIVIFTPIENDVRQDWKLGKITAKIESDHNDGIVFEVTYVGNNSKHKTTRRCQRDLVMLIRVNEPEYNSRAHLKELYPD